MSPRIQDLIDQCTTDSTSYFDGRGNVHETHFDKAKFAKLIIEECVQVARRADTADTEYAWFAIERHFAIDQPKGWVCPKCGIDRTKEVCPKGHTAALTGDCPMVGQAQ
jgi:hypothetical protein